MNQHPARSFWQPQNQVVFFLPAAVLAVVLLILTGGGGYTTVQFDSLQFDIPAIWQSTTLVGQDIDEGLVELDNLTTYVNSWRARLDADIRWVGNANSPGGVMVATGWRYTGSPQAETATAYVGRRVDVLGDDVVSDTTETVNGLTVRRADFRSVEQDQGQSFVFYESWIGIRGSGNDYLIMLLATEDAYQLQQGDIDNLVASIARAES